MRIPFDSLTLSACLRELQALKGARAQKWLAINATTVAVELYDRGVAWLWFSWHPEFFRIHLGPKPAAKTEPTPLLVSLRRFLTDAHLVAVQQQGLDRIVLLSFENAEGRFTLILELMGKHSNAILVDSGKRIVGAAKLLGASKTARPVLLNQPYEHPPTELRPSLLEAKPGDDLAAFEGVSPFLRKLIEAGVSLETVQSAFRGKGLTAVQAGAEFAYPIPVTELGLECRTVDSIGYAIHEVFSAREAQSEFLRMQGSLKTQLERVLLAREVAIHDLEQAADTAKRARSLQIEGELIMAYAIQIEVGQKLLTAWNYEGAEQQIKLNPELSPLENAETRFKKAKRAKAAAQGVNEQLGRLGEDASELRLALADLLRASQMPELAEIEREARAKRWLNRPQVAKEKSERPYEGHRITELLGPRGFRILVGENSEANDYLTLRIAKPDDWWLHVRGNVSAHVIIPTNKQPDKVPYDVIEFAAKVAVRKSPMKHSTHVPVDLTLKKYVRRIKGAPKGTVHYSHERVLHIDPD